MSQRVILRRDLDNEADRVRLVKFRLFYEGALGSQSARLEDHQQDRKGNHKHDIRMVFDAQLRHLWKTMPSLAAWQTNGEMFETNFGQRIGMETALYNIQPDVGGYTFIPLVCQEFSILCHIDVLILRRDKPGGIWSARDIDNRIKVLFDALSAPKTVPQLGSNAQAAANPGDRKPVYVLLQDDSLITQMSVETDELLAPPEGVDDSFARVVVTVDLSVYRAMMGNLGIF